MASVFKPGRLGYDPVNDSDDEKPQVESHATSHSYRLSRHTSRKTWFFLIAALLITIAVVGALTDGGRAQFNKFRPLGGGLQEYPAEYIGNNTEIGELIGEVKEEKWSTYAYVQYVTSPDYLCNSVMIFERLHELGTRADKLMLYPETYDISDTSKDSKEKELLLKARDEYGVKLKPIKVQHRNTGLGDATWADSYTKLLAFNQTEYHRIVAVDSDGTILQLLDELFLLPLGTQTVAMPRAYWGTEVEHQLSSQIMMLQPSEEEWKRIEYEIQHATGKDYDMEIVNKLYNSSCMVIPHERYDLLTGEFRADTHENYLGSPTRKWDPEAVLQAAKYLHFSDWPVPKPWISAPKDIVEKNQPKCKDRGQGLPSDCTERDIWLGFYKDFRQRRTEVCGMNTAKRSLEDEPSKWMPKF